MIVASCSHSTPLAFKTRVFLLSEFIPLWLATVIDVGGKTVMIKHLLTSLESQARIAGKEIATADFVHQCN